MLVIGSATQGAEAFDATLQVVQGPVFKLMEICLAGGVAYHAFDGVRLLIVHYFNVSRLSQRDVLRGLRRGGVFHRDCGLLILQALFYHA